MPEPAPHIRIGPFYSLRQTGCVGRIISAPFGCFQVFACGRETVRAFYNFLNLHTCSMLRNIWAWGGGGWGVITFLNLNTCRCYATSGLAHMFDATQHLGLHTCSMLRNIWACTHVRCYATSGLAHMFDATQHLGLHTCSMLRNIWACTHGCCYATPWVGVGWGVGGGGDDDVLWACTHVGCYGTADVLQGLHTCWMLQNC